MNRLELLQLRGILPTAEEVRRHAIPPGLYRDARGAFPVTAIGQPVGAIIFRDKVIATQLESTRRPITA